MTRSGFGYLFLLLLIGCSNPEFITIDATCEQDNSTDIVSIKWETFPPLEGQVKIFIEDQRGEQLGAVPILSVPISRGAVSLKKTDNCIQTKYRLLFNDRYSIIAANRFIQVDGVFNFRDIGGCRTIDDDHIKYGMIYRSASLDQIEPKGIEALHELGIKTIVNFRAPIEGDPKPDTIEGIRRVVIPISFGNVTPLLDRVIKKEATQRDVEMYAVELHRHFVGSDYAAFRQLFKIMKEPTNYPILISCSFGKDRTGFAVAHVMHLLGSSHECIISEFLLMTDLKRMVKRYSYTNDTLSVEMQEALTVLSQARREHIEAAYQQMVHISGTVEQYQQRYFLIDDRQKAFFRSILLQ